MTTKLSNFELQELDFAIKLLGDLVKDLRTIRQNGGPSHVELANAPVMQNWAIARRFEPCLSGHFSGHPTLREGNFGITSQIWFIDPHHKYVRTLSRFYRLGVPAESEGKRIQ